MAYKNVNVDIRVTPLKFYKDLLDKPSLNEHELVDNTTLEQIGLGNVDNTSDINKPISNSTKEALDLKADKSSLDETNIRVESNSNSLTNIKSDIVDINKDIEVINTALEGKQTKGDYATKEQLEAKQDKLTAGTNITIEGNVISAAGGGSAPDNMVTTDTEQTISGKKTFKNEVAINAGPIKPALTVDSWAIITNLGNSSFAIGDQNALLRLDASSLLTKDSDSNISNVVVSEKVVRIKILTQAEYDALETKDDSTLYHIVG